MDIPLDDEMKINCRLSILCPVDQPRLGTQSTNIEQTAETNVSEPLRWMNEEGCETQSRLSGPPHSPMRDIRSIKRLAK